jgi:DNA repair protein RadA/Sms
MIIAVLDKRAGAPVGSRDIFAATVGGVRLTEPATDLAIVCAVASSVIDRALATDVIALGEVGLAGEVRRVTGLQRRLAEASRLGFRHALVPPGSLDGGDTLPDGIVAHEVGDVARAIEAMGRLAGPRANDARAVANV